MTSLDVINEKQITVEVSGDEIVINVIKSAPTTFVALLDTPDAILANQFLRGNALGKKLEFFKYARRNPITLIDGATINIDLDNYLVTHGLLNNTTRVATILDFDNFPINAEFNLAITKDNGDLGLVFTLSGTDLIFNIYDPANNVCTRATTITIAGDDEDAGTNPQTWELNFLNSGRIDGTDAIIQVVGTIDSFA